MNQHSAAQAGSAAHVMSRTIIQVSAYAMLSQVTELLAQHQAAVVVQADETGDPIGLITEHEVVRSHAQQHPFDTTPARDVAIPVPKISSDTDLETVLQTMHQHDATHVLVMDAEDELQGILSETQVLRSLQTTCLARPKSCPHRQRENELQWLCNILEAINTAPDFDTAITHALQHFCKLAHWFCGEAWLPNADATRLHLNQVYYECHQSPLEGFGQQSQHYTFGLGEGLPGRVWEMRSPEWIPDVTQAKADFLRSHLAEGSELRTACGIPIMVNDAVVAVLVLFSAETRQPDTRFLHVTQSVAGQLGQAMLRKRTRDALQRSTQTTQTILNALPDLLIRMDRTGNRQQVLSEGNGDVFILPEQNEGYLTCELIPPHLVQQKIYYAQQALDTQSVQVYEHELIIQGEWRAEEVRIAPLNADEVLVIIRDITAHQSALRERQWAEAALRRSETMNRAIIAANPDLMIRMTASGKYMEVLSRKDIAHPALQNSESLPIEQVLPALLIQQRLHYIQQALATQSIQEYEQCWEENGETFFEEVRIAPLTHHEVLVIIRDVNDRKKMEIALKTSEERYRLLFEKNPHPMWVYAPETLQFLAVNEAAIAKYGYDHETFLSFTLRDIMAVEADAWPSVSEQLSTADTHIGTWPHALIDGTQILVEMVSHAIMLGDRSVRLALALDVTQRQMAEDALRQLNQELENRVAQRTAQLQESEERWQLALKGSNAGIWDWNYKTQTVFRSERWAELRGYTRDEVPMTQQAWYESIHPDDVERVASVMQAHVARQTPYFQAEYRIRHRDGSYRWILDRGQGLWGEDGNLVRIVGSETDITQRKQIELAQQESEARYRAVMDGANDIILLAHPDGRLVQGNRKATEILGYSNEELQQMNVLDLHLPHDQERAIAEFGSVVAEGSSMQFLNLTLVSKTGECIPTDVTASVIEVAGEPFALGIFRDIRRRKCIEDELRTTATHLAIAQRIAKIGSWEYDLATQTITWSDEVFHLFNRSLELGPPSYPELLQHVHPEDRDRHQQALQQTTQFGVPHDLEFRVVHASGDMRYLYARGELFCDSDGTPKRLVGTVVDITERKNWEMALQESEARYRAIVEDQTDLVCRFTPAGVLTFANMAYCRYFGITLGSEPILLWPLLTRENLDSLRQNLAQLSPQAPSITYEECDPQADGTLRWQIWTDRAIFDDAGTLVEYQSVGHDITDRKLAELALQDSEAKLRLFVKYTPAAVAMFDREIRYLVVSNRWRQDYGLGDRPILGHCHYDIFPTVPQRWKAIHQRCLEGAVETCQADPFLRETGEIDWVRWEVRPWHRADGSIGGIIMFTEVITEQIQAQQQLRQLSDRLSLAVRSGSMGIWEWDTERDVLTWDEQMYALYGIEPAAKSATYDTWRKRLHPEDRPSLEATLQRFLTGDDEFNTEFRIIRPDGALRYIRAFAIVQRDPQGACQRVVGINFDVTARREAEEQLRRTNQQLEQANQQLARATRLKDEFLASMSHELRTPLNAILGLSDGLKEQIFGEVNSAQTRAIATISDSGKHLLDLINDILDLSKIEAGKFELNLDYTDAESLCAVSLSFVEQMACQKHLTLNTHIAETIAPFRADARRLRQVLINLLSNAVKFTPEGGSVSLSATLDSDTSPSALIFCVEDSGIGIHTRDFDKLFQPFIQLDSHLNRQYAGTGLGLALTQRIVALHQGEILVESTVGRGSRFTVRLPYAPFMPESQPSSPYSADAIADESRPCPTVPSEPSRILVIGDSRASLDSIQDYLISQSFDVITACIREAIAQIQAHPPHLIVFDCQSFTAEDINSLQVLRQTSDLALPPMIVLSDTPCCDPIQAIATDYLPKPLSLKDLADRIRDHLTPFP